jgi:hypothetical protein
MDLWIRSQDKTLLAKYNRFAVSQTTPYTQAQVMGFVGYDFGYETLGRYTTKERALEVLDEIQELLTARICFENYNSFNLIYEMPEE